MAKTSFYEMLAEHKMDLSRTGIEILQVNVGKLCNMACLHCHVEAGPKRTEIIEAATVDRIIELLERSETIHTVDITGGAPEIVPDFRRLAAAAANMGKQVLDRCNLTIFFEEGHTDLPEFLRDHKVTVIASLPCYSRDNVEKQRGTGSFDLSIEGLIRLNELGYGKEGTGLQLDLVYNPFGAHLPPEQTKLEKDYKIALMEDFGIEFNKLYTITNIPIKRYLRQLKNWGKEEEYMDLLINNFNPHAAEKVMCRNLVSVGWEGDIFDCDFNQMVELPIGGTPKTIWDIENFDDLATEPIAFAEHCYGCTAGTGSSCGGSLVQVV